MGEPSGQDVSLMPEKGGERKKDGGRKSLRQRSSKKVSARPMGNPGAKAAHQKQSMSGRSVGCPHQCLEFLQDPDSVPGGGSFESKISTGFLSGESRRRRDG